MILYIRIMNLRQLYLTYVAAAFAWMAVPSGYAQNTGENPDSRVQEVVLNSRSVIPIVLSAGHVTTLLFPRPITSVVGYGMTRDPGVEDGWIQYDHPVGSGILTLRILKSDLIKAYMTVLVSDDLYDFELNNDPLKSALSIKLIDPATVQAQRQVAREVTPEEVKASRPVYDPARLHSLLGLAKNSGFLRDRDSSDYQGYEVRQVTNISDYDNAAATVREVHRFPADDAIVLLGELTNKSGRPISFNPAAMTVAVGDRQYPTAFVDCVGKLTANQTVNFGVVVQGDIDSTRAHLSVRNAFRVLLPQFDKKTPIARRRSYRRNSSSGKEIVPSQFRR